VSSAPTPIVVLASGRGSNFAALLRARDEGRLQVEIRALLTDNPEAGAIELARAAGVPVEVVAYPEKSLKLTVTERRAAHDRAVLEALRKHSPRFLVLAGYMRVMTPALIDAFRSARGYARIVNIHPSLLPAFPGVGSYAQAWRHGAKVTGVTVHLVEEEVDSGPICSQESFSIAECQSSVEVEHAGLAIEHRLYAQTLNWVLPEKFDVFSEEGRLHVRPR